MTAQTVQPKTPDQDQSKGAVEGDRPGDQQQSNKNAVGALDQNGMPKDPVKIAQDALGAKADDTQG